MVSCRGGSPRAVAVCEAPTGPPLSVPLPGYLMQLLSCLFGLSCISRPGAFHCLVECIGRVEYRHTLRRCLSFSRCSSQKCSLAKRTLIDLDLTFNDSVLTSRARALGCRSGALSAQSIQIDDPAHAAKVNAHAGLEARFPSGKIGAGLDRRGERGEDLLKVGAAEQRSRAQQGERARAIVQP